MVRRRTATKKKIFGGQITPWELEKIISGFEYDFLAGKENSNVESAWKNNRGWLLEEHVKKYPGTRPWAWWRFDAAEPRKCFSEKNKRFDMGEFFGISPIVNFDNQEHWECQFDYLQRTKNRFSGEVKGDDESVFMIGDWFMPKVESLTRSDKTAIEEGCFFDRRQAYRVWRFLTRYIKLSHGQWGGQPFIPQSWQWRDILAPMFGWQRPNGTRRFRRSFIFVPKKNGKSTMCSSLVLYLLTEGEDAAEVYSVATATEQANIVYRETKRMTRKSTDLEAACKIIDSRKTMEFGDCFYKSLSGDAASSEGLNIHGLIVDELHAWTTPSLIELYRSLRYGGAARRQPLSIVITTAGEIDGDSLWEEEYEASKGVKNGRLVDTALLPFIAEAGPEDDWCDPVTWSKANPSFGNVIREEEMKEKCDDAKTSERKKRDFLRYRLNRPVHSVMTWLNIEEWNKNDGEPQHKQGMNYIGALDMSSTSDLTAFVVTAKDGDIYHVWPHFFIPEIALAEHIGNGHVLYEMWRNSGLLNITPGNVTDNNEVMNAVLKWHEQYRLKEMLYDPWNASGIVQRLQEEDIECIEFRQGMKSFAEPTKNLEILVKQGRIRHGGHAVLSWNAENTEVKSDENGNIRPVKSKNRDKKIDGIVSLIMSLSRSMTEEEASVYESRGVLFL